jgi:hypothetical protein
MAYKDLLIQEYCDNNNDDTIVFDNTWLGYAYLVPIQLKKKCNIVHSHHGMCFIEGTPMFTDKRMIPIESISAGYKVLGNDGLFHRVTKTIVREIMNEHIVRLEVQTSPNIVLTPEHPVLTLKTTLGGCRGNNLCTSICSRQERIAPKTYVHYHNGKKV